MKIISAILEKTSDDVLFQINQLSPYFKIFQIDIADGVFVPNKTVQIDELFLAIKQSNNIKAELSFDFHLMVKDYEKEIEKLEKLRKFINIKNVFIHYSLSPNYQLLSTNYPHFTFGIVLNPEDSVKQLTSDYQLSTLASIQIMSISPGFQGSAFIPQTIKKIEQLRTLGYRSKIYIDGGINEKTLPIILLRKYQPEFLVIGSYLTKAASLKKHMDYLKGLSNKAKSNN